MSDAPAPIRANLVLFALICALLQCGVFGFTFVQGLSDFSASAAQIGVMAAVYGLSVASAGYAFVSKSPAWTQRDRHLLSQGYALVSLFVGFCVDVILNALFVPNYFAEMAAAFGEAGVGLDGWLVPVALIFVVFTALIILACSYAFARLVLFILFRPGSTEPHSERGAQ